MAGYSFSFQLLCIVSYFQIVDLQNQAMRRIPSLYNVVTLVGLERRRKDPILSHEKRAAYLAKHKFLFSGDRRLDEIHGDRRLEEIFNTSSYVSPSRLLIMGSCSAFRVPQ